MVLFATLAIVLGVLFSLNTKPPKTATPIVQYAAPPPAVVAVVSAPTEVTASYVEKKPVFPNVLPEYQFTNHIYTNDETANLAQVLGFVSPPTRLRYGKEIRTEWKSNESTLSFTVNGAGQSLSYNLFLSKIKTAPTQPLLNIARLFVEKNFFSDETTGLVLQKEMTDPMAHIQTTETPNPELHGYLFTRKTPNLYDIVSDQFTPYVISVVIDQYGVVRRVSFASPPTVLQAQEKPLLSFNNAVSSINKNLGVLVSISQKGNSYWEKTPQFKSVFFSDSKIVYYANQSTSLLVPFYLLYGTAGTTEGIVDVVYAVAAVEQY